MRLTTTKEAIYEYLDRGWSIIPICANDKTPLVKWKKFQTRQPTEDEIDFWLEKWPDMLIAVVCGAISGIIVVDADNPDAQQAAHDQGFESPVMVKTKRGRHWYFKHPLDGVHRGPQSGSGSKGEVWPQINGLDFRGDGSYALLPPSTHYTWDILNDHDLDDMPLFQDWRPSKSTNTNNEGLRLCQPRPDTDQNRPRRHLAGDRRSCSALPQQPDPPWWLWHLRHDIQIPWPAGR